LNSISYCDVVDLLKCTFVNICTTVVGFILDERVIVHFWYLCTIVGPY